MGRDWVAAGAQGTVRRAERRQFAETLRAHRFGRRTEALAPEGAGTIANLRSNASIEINVVDQLVRKGYRFKGTGAVYTDGDVFERGVRFYEARGTVKARERIRGIVIVSVERALPVTSPAYDIGATEDELRESNLRRLTARPAEPQVPQDP
jgi:hypothetical protein